jgi:hypothetical protein
MRARQVEIGARLPCCVASPQITDILGFMSRAIRREDDLLLKVQPEQDKSERQPYFLDR